MKKQKFASRAAKWHSKTYQGIMLVMVVVFGVVTSLLAQHLEEKNGLRADLSFNHITSLGDITKELLATLDQPVHISAVAARGDEDHQLMDLLTRYQSQNPNITWEMVVPSENPTFIKTYEDKGETLVEDSLVIQAAQTGRYRIIDPSQYVTVDYNTNLEYELRYQYEKMITEGILYTTADYIPKVLFSAGHKEQSDITLLQQILASNSFEVDSVDLSDETHLLEGNLLFILDPKKDFTQNEIQNVLTFLQKGGALFVTLDPTTNPDEDIQNLPNLMALLSSYGIVPTKGVVMADEGKTDTYQVNTLLLLPTLTDSTVNTLLIENDITYIALPYTRGFLQPEVYDDMLQVENLLLSDVSAYEQLLIEPTTNTTKEETAVGPFGLAVLATRLETTGNTAKVFALGSTIAINDSDMLQYSDNQSFLHQVLTRLVPRENYALNITTKQAYRPTLTQNSTPLGVAMVIVLPMLIIVAATLILWPRRYL